MPDQENSFLSADQSVSGKTSDKLAVGLIINPIAGMGGAVGLKGSDGTEILEEAKELGAIPHAIDRAKEFLTELRGLKTRIVIKTCQGVMGEQVATDVGFEVITPSDNLGISQNLYQTIPQDTIKLARYLKEQNVALIVFVGGDGTARNMVEAVGDDFPCLGIPGGVKIHSSVFATNPKLGGQLALSYLWGEAPLRESEVMDIDEDAFRDNQVISKLYGYLKTPYIPLFTQPSKMASPISEDEQDNKARIARWIVEEMEKLSAEGWYYLIGPGTTTRSIAVEMQQEKTLLGADLYFKQKLIAKDLNEQQILEHVKGRKVKLYVTPIGGQGFVFGRGNLQLSAKVLETIGLENINIIATKYKISQVPQGKLRVDSRDPEFDEHFKGYYRVLVDYGEFRIIDIIR